MTPADLNKPQNTKESLQAAMQVLRSARRLSDPGLPNHLASSAIPTDHGATTGKLRFGGRLNLNFKEGMVCYEKEGRDRFKISIKDLSQIDLFNATFSALATEEFKLAPERDKVTGTAPLLFAFLMEILLIVHFALRRWRFEKAMRMGWVYGVLGIPGVLLSIYLWLAGMAWYFVIAGFLTGAWALLGFYVDGVKGIEWRGPSTGRCSYPISCSIWAPRCFSGGIFCGFTNPSGISTSSSTSSAPF